MLCFLLVFTPLARAGIYLWAKTVIQMIALTGIFTIIVSGIMKQTGGVKRTPLDLPLAGTGLLVFGAAARSAYSDLAVEGATMFLTYVAIYYIGVSSIRTRKQQRIIIYVIAGTALFTSLVAVLKYFGMNPFPFWIYPDLSRTNFFTGTFGNHNHFAGYLEMAVPVTLCLLLTRSRPLSKQMLILSIVLVLLVCLGMSFSRGGGISVCLALGFMTVVACYKNIFGKKLLLRSAIISLFVMITLFITTPVFQRLAPLFFSGESELVGFRLKVWSHTIDMIAANPVTGTGPGTYAQAFPLHSPPGLGVLPAFAHNDYLQFTADTGLFFIPLLIWILIVFFRTGFAGLNSKSRQTSGITMGGMASVFAILIHSAFDFNLHIPANSITFVALASLVCAKTSSGSRHIQGRIRGDRRE